MQVPDWLLKIIAKCLEKKPENRFKSGFELHEAIVYNSTQAIRRNEDTAASATVLQTENERLQSQLRQYQEAAIQQEREVARLKETLARKEAELSGLRNRPDSPAPAPIPARDPSTISIPKAAFFAFLFLLAGLGAFAAYQLFSNRTKVNRPTSSASNDSSIPSDTTGLDAGDYTVENESASNAGTVAERNQQPDDEATDDQTANTPKSATNPAPENNSTTEQASDASDTETDRNSEGRLYTVESDFANFHTQPDESTRQEKIHINKWNNARLKPLKEQNGFIYVEYTNDRGQVTKGWLSKKDLRRIDD